MAIDIAPYIAEIQRLMGVVYQNAKSSGLGTGQIFTKDQKDILISGAFNAATKLSKEIYDEVKKKEGSAYDWPGNEWDMLAVAMIFSSWSAWVFKAKSADPHPNRVPTREGAKAVSKYVDSMIANAVKGGQNIGKDNGQSEGRKEPINIS